MADNLSVRDGDGFSKSLATKEVSAGIHLTKHLLADETGAAIEPATEAGQAIIGTRAYGTAIARLAYSVTSAQSSAIIGNEVLLHNCGPGRCFVRAASNPTATTDDIPMEPGEKFHMRVTSGHKVAALQDSETGNLNIVPVS